MNNNRIEYPCVTCLKPCYKNNLRAFCSDECRFFSHVEVTSGCWLWKGSKTKLGYGKTCFRGKAYMAAHRMSYELFVGAIPEGKCVCHSCDIPNCVNPQHLWIGSNTENDIDKSKKGRSANRKLNESDAIEIRNLKGNGMSYSKLANLYKVAGSTIYKITKRISWKYI
jgi:hypothetical protein